MTIVKNARRLTNLAHEWLLGISTRGVAPAENSLGVHYATVDYVDIKSILQELDLKPTDVLVDIGSGKGRVVCLAARRRLGRIVGVEYSRTLSELARVNVARLRGRRTPIDLQTMAAEDYDYSDATVLYLFNPFEAEILDTVLKKVRHDRGDRPVRIAFVMESPAQKSVFDIHTWLGCKRRWTDRAGHTVALYSGGSN
jgi:SAM-dependent methyltransferase